jgi:hypothetical protein
MLKWLVAFFLLGISSAYAQSTEQSSKIDGYGVLDTKGEQSSKLEGYGVLDTNGLQNSKITGYAVLGVGPQLAKLEGYAVLDGTVPFASIGASKFDGYGVLTPSPPIPPFSPPGPGSCASPTIDGLADGQNTFAPPTIALTTTKPNDIIFLHIATLTFAANHTDPPAPVIAILDDASLSWARRGTRQTYTVADEVFKTASVDEFWAYSAAPLTADNITWTYGAGTLSFSLGVAVGIPGVNSTLAPFDANISLPATAMDTTTPGFSQPQVSISTSNAADLLISSCTSQAISGLCSTVASPGWTYIDGPGFTAVSGDLQTVLYYKRVTSLQAAATENIDGATTHNWLAIVDAFAGGDGGAGCNVRPQVWIAQ